MKPIVIYPKQLKEDQIVLTKKKFEKYLKDAYDSGYEDGCKIYWTPITWTNNTTTPYYDWTRVTCDTNTSTIPDSLLNELKDTSKAY